MTHKQSRLDYLKKQITNLTLQLNVTENSLHSALRQLGNLTQLVHTQQELLFMESEARKQLLLGAATSGNVTAVRLLKAVGLNVSARDGDGYSALHLAAGQGHLAVVRALLDAGADPRARTRWGWTALHEAGLAGHLDTCRLLLDRGSLATDRTIYDSTALHLAAGAGHLYVAKLLASRGAELNAVDKAGQTPLDLAAKAERRAVVEWMRHQVTTRMTR